MNFYDIYLLLSNYFLWLSPYTTSWPVLLNTQGIQISIYVTIFHKIWAHLACVKAIPYNGRALPCPTEICIITKDC